MTDDAIAGRAGRRRRRSRRRPLRERPLVVHLTTTDMSLDWLLAPQLRAFGEAGYDVVGMSAAGPHVPSLEAAGIRHVPLSGLTRASSPLHDLRALAQLVGALRRLRPDVLHTHNPKPGVLGRIAGRVTGVPLVVNTQHGLYAQPGDPLRRRIAVYTLERIAAAFGHLELVQNPEDVHTLVHTLRVPGRKVRLLGNGIDLARFDPETVDPSARASRRAEWGIDDHTVLVGVVGRLVREKGLVEIVDAARQLRARHLDARVVVIGPHDPDKADALAAETATGGDSAVTFVGARADMPECYAAMDLFLTASWREGFPRSAMEAAAMGLPTVASDIRGNRQVVDDGRTGVLVAVRDADALADGIAALIARRDDWSAMADAARAKALLEFDQQTVIARTLAAYRGQPDPAHLR